MCLPEGVLKVHLANIQQTAAKFPDLKFFINSHKKFAQKSYFDECILGLGTASRDVGGGRIWKSRFDTRCHCEMTPLQHEHSKLYLLYIQFIYIRIFIDHILVENKSSNYLLNKFEKMTKIFRKKINKNLSTKFSSSGTLILHKSLSPAVILLL